MLIDLIKKNRSVRGYSQSRKATNEELLSMINHARLCPVGRNIQNLRYRIVLNDNEVKDVNCNIKYAMAHPEWNLPLPGTEPSAFIVICHDQTYGKYSMMDGINVGIAAQTITLSATEMGLSGCMIASFNKENIKKALNLDENIIPILVLSIGESCEEICLVDINETGDSTYYRDEESVHYVPKKKLEDVLL